MCAPQKLSNEKNMQWATTFNPFHQKGYVELFSSSYLINKQLATKTVWMLFAYESLLQDRWVFITAKTFLFVSTFVLLKNIIRSWFWSAKQNMWIVSNFTSRTKSLWMPKALLWAMESFVSICWAINSIYYSLVKERERLHRWMWWQTNCLKQYFIKALQSLMWRWREFLLFFHPGNKQEIPLLSNIHVMSIFMLFPSWRWISHKTQPMNRAWFIIGGKERVSEWVRMKMAPNASCHA